MYGGIEDSLESLVNVFIFLLTRIGSIKSEDEWNITAFVSASVEPRFILTINRPINSLPEPQLETLFRSPFLRHCDDHDHFSDFGDHDDFVGQQLG